MKKSFLDPKIEIMSISYEVVTDTGDGSVTGGGDTTSKPEGWV